MVEAATVVYQGAPWSAVEAPAPLLPAETETKMPASAAPSMAWSTGEYTVVAPSAAPIEKLMTSTPSATAWSIAAIRSSSMQPSSVSVAASGPDQQTL